jgi:hypothetical protein
MRKIGIITLYSDNFGSILQAYATYSFLSSLGNECSILQINYSQSYLDKLKKLPGILYRSIRYKSYYTERRCLKETSRKESNLLSINTKKLMNAFVSAEFKVESFDSNKLELLNSKYDYFITGSDQVWNGYDEFRYLVFTDRNKRIALAPSFGASGVKDYFKKDIKKALNGFDSLSAREESGVKIIKELTGKDAVRLPDPTLLLTEEDWIEFATKGTQKTNYILLHFLNKPNELAIKIINMYLKGHDCSAYCICNKYEEYDQLLRYEFLDISPYDYVSLISGANFVFNDSFHSTLFSLNLETQFLTFERQYLHGNSQSSRIMDMLNRVGMPDRFVVEECSIDFDQEMFWNSDSLFQNERDRIKEYIEKVLGK